jgi:hypothetical protein
MEPFLPLPLGLDSGLSVIALTPEDSWLALQLGIFHARSSLEFDSLIGFTFAIRSHAERLLLSARLKIKPESAEQCASDDEFNTLFDGLPARHGT